MNHLNELSRVCVRAYDVNTLYMHLLATLRKGLKSSPRGMPITETLAAQVILDDPARCLVTLPERLLNYRFAIAEWLWIASGDNRVESIAPYCNEIKKYSDNGETFFGAYGPRWRPQVERVIELLKSDPDSRQAVVETWRDNSQWLSWVESNAEEGRQRWLAVTKDVPCTLTTQYLIRDEQLVTLVNMRSWDAWLGLPYDVFNFSMLGSMVAAELDIAQGPLCVTAGSLHLYDRDREKVDSLITKCSMYGASSLVSEPVPPADRLIIGSEMYAREGAARSGSVSETIGEPWISYYSIMAGLEPPNQVLARITRKSQ
jgi:thymidylate synthase